MTSFQFGDQQSTQTPSSGFPFGATSVPSSLNAPATGFAVNPLATSTPFSGLAGATATTSSIFGTTQTTPAFSTSLFPTSTATTSTFPASGIATSTAPGFNFGVSTTTSTFGTPSTAAGFGTSTGGFGTAASGTFGVPSATSFGAPGAFGTSATGAFGTPATGAFGGLTGGTFSIPTCGTFGTGSIITATTSSAPATVGLGGVDIQATSGLNGSSSSNKKDSKAIKESQIPNELSVTVDSFKKYVKEQKAIREEMSRVSSKNIVRVQEQVDALKQQLSVVVNGLQRNAVAIAKLKEESNCELKNAEIAQRTHDAPNSMQYENNAPTEYFENLANSFEKQMQSYRQQIEQLERHLISLTQPFTLTSNEWIAIRQRLHDTFVTLAAQLQTVHQEVQLYKERFINQQKLNNVDVRPLLGHQRNFLKDPNANSHLPSPLTYGPSPFSSEQSAVGKAISNAFNRSQALPGLAGGNLSSSFNLNRNTPFQTSTPFKPLGQIGVPFGSSSPGEATGFASDSSAQFGFNSQKTFQLQKPPAGNKRGKRYTST